MASGGAGGGYSHSLFGPGFGRVIGISVGAGGPGATQDGVNYAGRGGNGRGLIEWGNF